MAEYSQEYFVRRMLDEIRGLKCWRPNILFRTKTAIGFREVEDLIAWMLRNSKRIISAKDPAIRFVCREGEGSNRYYYMVQVVYAKKISAKAINPFRLLEDGEAKELKLIAGDATDYSGHGQYDKNLMETFIKHVLRLRIEDRSSSYLIDILEGLLAEEA